MPQTLQQESLIVALSKCAIKIGIEKISEKFNCFVMKTFLCQQGRFSKIRSHIGFNIVLPVRKLGRTRISYFSHTIQLSGSGTAAVIICSTFLQLNKGDIILPDAEISTMNKFIDIMRPFVEMTEGIGGGNWIIISSACPLIQKITSCFYRYQIVITV